MQLVDAGMVAFAAWHALKGRVEWPLTYQVPRMLRSSLREAGAGAPVPYLLCWNAERLRKRERWPPYRDRPEIWEEAGRDDFRRMYRVLSALGAVQFRADGWEADEVLAALVHRLPGDGELVIRSDDKDFMQLLSDGVRMEGRVRGTVLPSDVREILGVDPDFVADFLALAGDEADGIPRIVPPSTARELLEARGHVREWLDREPEADPELAATLEGEREQLRLNLELVDLGEEAVGEPPAPDLEEWGEDAVLREIGEATGIGWLTGDDPEEDWSLLRAGGRAARERLGA